MGIRSPTGPAIRADVSNAADARRGGAANAAFVFISVPPPNPG